jgi:hypothetical protein
MLTASIEDAVNKQRINIFSTRNAAPYHDNHERKEPLQKVQLIHANHLERHHHYKNWYQDGRVAETFGNEEIRGVCSPRTADVLELTLRIKKIAGHGIFQQTLISGSRSEI